MAAPPPGGRRQRGLLAGVSSVGQQRRGGADGGGGGAAAPRGGGGSGGGGGGGGGSGADGLGALEGFDLPADWGGQLEALPGDRELDAVLFGESGLGESDWGELPGGLLAGALAAEEEELLRTLGGGDAFGSSGRPGSGGTPGSSGSPEGSFDDLVQDRKVVVAAALASGARQHGDAPGTLRRAAFSMNDLNAMDPSSLPGLPAGGSGGGPPAGRGRGRGPPMQPVMEGQAPGPEYHYHPRLPMGGYPGGGGYPQPGGHGGAYGYGYGAHPPPSGAHAGGEGHKGESSGGLGYPPPHPGGPGGRGAGGGAPARGGVKKGGMRRTASVGDLALAGRAPPPAAAAGGGAKAGAPGAGPGGEKEPLRAPSGALRIGKLTIEERRQRILRYRQKRHERNFKKRIKYACRKTLADSRPRIRGRFATNEEWDALKKKKAEEDAKAKAGSKK